MKNNAFRPEHLAIAIGLSAVVCAGIGALQGSPPADVLGLGLMAGILLGAGSQGPRSRGATRLGWIAAALFAASLPALEGAAQWLTARTGTPILGALPVVVLAFPIGRALTALRGPSAAAAGVGALVGALLVPSLLSQWGSGVVGLGGLVAAAVARGSAGPHKPTPGGLAAGLTLGTLPWLGALGAPLHGPDATWWATAAAATLAGVGLGRALGPRSPALDGLGAVGVLGAAAILVRLPDLGVRWWAAKLPAELMGLPGPSTAVTAIAFASVGLLLPAAGRYTPVGAAVAGLGGALALPWLGPDSTLMALGGAIAAVSLAGVAVGERRAPAAIATLAGFACLGLPPAALGPRLAAPYAHADPTGLAAIVRAPAHREFALLAGPQGTAVRGRLGRDQALWLGGYASSLDPEQVASDRFVGLLPALLTGDPGRVLVLGDRTGTLADSARRAAASAVVIHAPSGPHRTVLRELTGPNRDVTVDPAVRLARRDPLRRGARFDAVLVDLPPPWVPGGRSAWSAARVRRVAGSLAPGGIAAFRLPVQSLTPEELRGWLPAMLDAFPGSSAWLAPSGGRHLIVVGHTAAGPIDAGAVFRAWTKASVRRDLRAAALREPLDVLERGIAGREALVAASLGPRRGPGPASVRSGLRVRRGRSGGALAGLSTNLKAPTFDLAGIPPDQRADAEERLATAAGTRGDYISLLQALEQGDAAAVLAGATRLAGSSGATAKDLRAVISPWLRRGAAYREQGLLDQARGEFLVASQLSPADVDVAVGLGDVLRQLGDLPGAEEAYGRAIERAPDDVRAVFGLSAVRVAQGRLPESVALLEDAERLHPGEPALLNNLAWGHLQLAAEDPTGKRLERARVLFQRAAALAPRMTEPHAGLAAVFDRLDHMEEAIAAVDRARALDPGNCNYQGQRGIYLERMGRLAEAAGSLRQSLLGCPDNPDALNGLGVVLTQQGEHDQAADLLTRALAINPQHAGARANLAKLELIRGALDDR